MPFDNNDWHVWNDDDTSPHKKVKNLCCVYEVFFFVCVVGVFGYFFFVFKKVVLR